MMEITVQRRDIKVLGSSRHFPSASHGPVWMLRGGQSARYTAPVWYSRVPCTGCVTVDSPSDLAEPPISKLEWG